MQLNQSSYANQHLVPDNSVHQSVTETSFDFSNQIDSNRKPKTERLLMESSENDDYTDKLAAETSFDCSNFQFKSNRKPDTEILLPESIESRENGDFVDQSQQLIPKSPETDDSVVHSEAEVTVGLSHLQIEANDDSKSQKMTSESPEYDDEDEGDDDDDEGDFTFMCIGDKDSPTELSESSQIRFPLFDQSLLSSGDNRLPITVPVDNVFIESPHRYNGDTTGVSTGTFCAVSKKPESGSPDINIKSNSTGFSKLWRFRDNMNRSNSDSRDAFVFFQTDNNRATSSSSNGKVTAVKNVAGKLTEKVVKKEKKKVKSAHEVYLKQKGGKTEEDRRRSYLPYRPGLMGFFTNVNGGLSKNVHPF